MCFGMVLFNEQREKLAPGLAAVVSWSKSALS